MAREDEVDALLAGIGHSPDDDRAAASAEARRRSRWLRQVAAESATLAGILLALAEHETAVTLRAGPWAHTGRLRSVTGSLVVIEVADGVALVPLAAVTSVSAPAAVADDRVPAPGPDLAGVLSSLVGERPALRLLLADGTAVAGRLEVLGKDVAQVRLTSSIVTVRLAALAGVVVLDAGNRSGRRIR